ncbi:hypothetical protein, partial [Rhodococcus wratislaviensis]|uniref:hypothetical protein n=1 Tax=Rhodococcus wratislaviensis TaxID=44752 RepID=UPI001CEC06E6
KSELRDGRQHEIVRLLSDGRCFEKCRGDGNHGQDEMFFGVDFDTLALAASELDVVPVTTEAAIREIGIRRRKVFERATAKALAVHWNHTSTLTGFVQPEPDMLRFPSASKSPLTDLDLTSPVDLRTLLIRRATSFPRISYRCQRIRLPAFGIAFEACCVGSANYANPRLFGARRP